MLSGFVGYFESVLFDDVMISINPKTASNGMFSWFPVYFPITVCFLLFFLTIFIYFINSIQTPVKVVNGSTVKLSLWRMCTDRKVWYEWCAETNGEATIIHNKNGSGYSIGL
jgi:protein arginine N-methyltransferase 5